MAALGEEQRCFVRIITFATSPRSWWRTQIVQHQPFELLNGNGKSQTSAGCSLEYPPSFCTQLFRVSLRPRPDRGHRAAVSWRPWGDDLEHTIRERRRRRLQLVIWRTKHVIVLLRGREDHRRPGRIGTASPFDMVVQMKLTRREIRRVSAICTHQRLRAYDRHVPVPIILTSALARTSDH